jgi:hypothetical protein
MEQGIQIYGYRLPINQLPDQFAILMADGNHKVWVLQLSDEKILNILKQD